MSSHKILAASATCTTASSGNDIQNVNSLHHFDGTNYLQWSQVVCSYLKVRDKMSHLTDEGPNQTGPGFKAWDEEDSMIMSWLLNSMKPEISRNLMFLTTSKAIWENLQQTYCKKKDAALIYDLKIQVSSMKQGNMSVMNYYNRMAGLWLKIDHNRDLQLECSDDVRAVQELLQNDRVFEFLAGLNAEYDQIRVQILGKNPMPSLEEIVSIVRAEEASAMVYRRPGKRRSKGHAIRLVSAKSKKTNGKDELWCTHCHKPRHTIDGCYRVHGKAQVLARTRTDDDSRPVDNEKILDVCDHILSKHNLDTGELENGSKHIKSTSFQGRSIIPTITGSRDELLTTQTRT